MTTTPDGAPTRPSNARPDATHELRDGTGAVLGWTVIDDATEPVRAEPLVRLPRIDARQLARVAAIDLAGMRVATDDEELADALVATGGTLVRRATVMATHPPRRPTTDAAPPPRYQVLAMDRLPTPPEALADALTGPNRAAYPPEHADHDPDVDGAATTTRLRALLSGRVTGPLDPTLSAIVRRAADPSPVGAIIVTHQPAGAIWPGGPWIVELFVHPRHTGQGLGRSLLGHTLAACGRFARERVGLAVTHGNQAAALYRSVGFTDLFHSWAIELPHDPPGDVRID